MPALLTLHAGLFNLGAVIVFFTIMLLRITHPVIYWFKHYLRLSLAFPLLLVLPACGELPYTNLDSAELETLLDSGIPLYDIRRVEEWRQTGIVEGSQLLTFVDAGGRVKPDFLQQFTEDVGQHDPVILICRTGNRTSTLARHLAENMGYTRVYNVRNGITQWIREKRPVKRQ